MEVAVKITVFHVEPEDLTAVDMNTSVFWQVTACGPANVNRCFEHIISMFMAEG
jgi:hypothetical protein